LAIYAGALNRSESMNSLRQVPYANAKIAGYQHGLRFHVQINAILKLPTETLLEGDKNYEKQKKEAIFPNKTRLRLPIDSADWT
jgi:hypothetical protein